MKIIQPGHVYQLANLDESELHSSDINELVFVGREPENNRVFPGTQNQEVLRCLIDRVKYCDSRLPCEENKQILYHLRMALLLHEARATRRKVEKGELEPEYIEVSEKDGHFRLPITTQETHHDP